MRDKLLKIFVDPDNYKLAQSLPCSTVEKIGLSDNQMIKKFDFIVFTDNSGNEVLRILVEMAENKVYYTSSMCISNDFTRAVVLTNLYNSIMHLRHGAFTDRKVFLKHFPVDMVKYEIQIIRLCVRLLKEEIPVGRFAEELNMLTKNGNSYCLESTAAVLKQYPWNYKVNKHRRESIEKIENTVAEIENCLTDKKRWCNIWRLAYHIHNEPAGIQSFV